MKTKFKILTINSLFYLGDFFCYPYTWCMNKSYALQEKWNLEEPWKKPEENELDLSKK